MMSLSACIFLTLSSQHTMMLLSWGKSIRVTPQSAHFLHSCRVAAAPQLCDFGSAELVLQTHHFELCFSNGAN